MALRTATQKLRPKVDLIFAIKRDFAGIKEPFPAHVWTPAAAKSYREELAGTALGEWLVLAVAESGQGSGG